MTVKLLPKHDMEFLSLKGGYTGLSESTLIKMSHCLKSHVGAHMYCCNLRQVQMMINCICLVTILLIYITREQECT